VALFCNPASGGTLLSTAIEMIKWVKKIAVAQAKVTHILRPGKASQKTLKGVIPLILCKISQNASRKKIAPCNCSSVPPPPFLSPQRIPSAAASLLYDSCNRNKGK
jgi:hypothetical protein